MIFNFLLGGLSSARLMALEDVVRPLVWGLRGAGHRAIAFGRRFEAAPALNLLPDDAVAGLPDTLVRARNEAGSDVRIGLICPEGLDAARRRAAETVHVTWSGTSIDGGGGDGPALASIRFGFHPALLGHEALPEARREVGVVLYGEDSPRRAALAAQLEQALPRFLFLRPGHFPDFIVADLLSRATTVVVTRDAAHRLSLAPQRILKALCNGTGVLAEAEGLAGLSLAPLVASCAHDKIVERCRAGEPPGGFAAGGAAALARLRTETSMADGLREALVAAGA